MSEIRHGKLTTIHINISSTHIGIRDQQNVSDSISVKVRSDNAGSTSILSSQGGLTTTFQSKNSLQKPLSQAESGLHYPWRQHSRHV